MSRALVIRSMIKRPGAARLAALLCLCGGAVLAHAATPGVDAPPEPAPPRPIAVPDFEEATLPSGLRVVVARRPELPIVSVALQLPVGSVADPAGKAGLADMTATLLTKGAVRHGKREDATQIARDAEALGGSLNAGAGAGTLSVGMTVTTPKLDAAMSLISDVALRPTLEKGELDLARDQAIDGLKIALADPGSLASFVGRRVFWGESPYGAVTTPDSLRQIDRADVQRFHRLWMRPRGAALILAGDITLADAVRLAHRHFDAWPTTRMMPPPVRREGAQPMAQSTVIVNLPGSGQSGVAVLAPYIDANSPQRRVGQVAAAVLGGGYSARLNQEVRIKRVLSYDAGASVASYPVDAAGKAGVAPAIGGVLAASAQTKHASAAEVATIMREQITLLGQTAPPADELAAREATLVGSFGRRLETTSGLASMMAEQIANGRPLADIRNTPAEVLAVTADQVRDFAREHWQPQALKTVVVGDAAAQGAAIDKLDPAPLRLDASALRLQGPTLQR